MKSKIFIISLFIIMLSLLFVACQPDPDSEYYTDSPPITSSPNINVYVEKDEGYRVVIFKWEDPTEDVICYSTISGLFCLNMGEVIE